MIDEQIDLRLNTGVVIEHTRLEFTFTEGNNCRRADGNVDHCGEARSNGWWIHRDDFYYPEPPSRHGINKRLVITHHVRVILCKCVGCDHDPLYDNDFVTSEKLSKFIGKYPLTTY